MRKNLLVAAALGGAAYWASKQPGGIKGTWNRLREGFRDIQSGQDPREVGKRFLSGGERTVETSTAELEPTARPAAYPAHPTS